MRGLSSGDLEESKSGLRSSSDLLNAVKVTRKNMMVAKSTRMRFKVDRYGLSEVPHYLPLAYKHKVYAILNEVFTYS